MRGGEADTFFDAYGRGARPPAVSLAHPYLVADESEARIAFVDQAAAKKVVRAVRDLAILELANFWTRSCFKKISVAGYPQFDDDEIGWTIGYFDQNGL